MKWTGICKNHVFFHHGCDTGMQFPCKLHGPIPTALDSFSRPRSNRASGLGALLDYSRRKGLDGNGWPSMTFKNNDYTVSGGLS